MTWAFLILGVTLVVAVLAVALGWGEPLARAYPDRPDPLLPAGSLVAGDLRRLSLTRTWWGYCPDEVDGLLERLASQLDTAVTDPNPLTDPTVGAGRELAADPTTEMEDDSA